ncbi:Uncharacterised protein [Bordetella pertussis]|nr:Uncharacterised protein [Bordetella pertussis]CFP55090.1 Uncharacterised protein [Bordetella pertussis]CFU07342.1 Uncharacterised protein [Bordetella pertussis]CPK08499.1 Uncharacterised protein [Bordetella pertussis]CPK27822.1 Uncharacterised protein [Bordetella pertussis]
MRLDDDRVAGGQAGEQARIAVPGGEGRAADHQRDAARHHGEALFHLDGVVLALRLFPERHPGDARHFLPGIGHGLDAAVLRMRAAGLEGLAGGVLHGVGHLEAAAVQALEDLQRHAHPGARPSPAPLLQGLGRCRDQRFGRDLRIGNTQFEAERRDLAPHGARGLRQIQRERLAAQRLERGLAVLGGGFAVIARAGRLGERAPIAALRGGFQRFLQHGLVAFKEILGHCAISVMNSCIASLAGTAQVSWSKSMTSRSLAVNCQ